MEDTSPAADWPDKGVVEFKDYKTRYRPGLDLVLKGLTFNVESCEKVSITFITCFYFICNV